MKTLTFFRSGSDQKKKNPNSPIPFFNQFTLALISIDCNQPESTNTTVVENGRRR
jgi:hypothetical protein